MDFRTADTFTDSLARLTDAEQKLAKTTAFDLQLNPASPGRHHRLNKSKDPNLWSVRVGNDLRLIVHKTATSLMLCYVDHDDAAYAWAERRKIERHPEPRAAQLVEESFFVRPSGFLGQNDPFRALRTTLNAEINEEAWSTLNSDISRPLPKPANMRIAVNVINHLGDEVMKVFRV